MMSLISAIDLQILKTFQCHHFCYGHYSLTHVTVAPLTPLHIVYIYKTITYTGFSFPESVTFGVETHYSYPCP